MVIAILTNQRKGRTAGELFVLATGTFKLPARPISGL